MHDEGSSSSSSSEDERSEVGPKGGSEWPNDSNKVLLLHWAGTGEVVDKVTINSLDPKAPVHGQVLGLNCSTVSMT